MTTSEITSARAAVERRIADIDTELAAVAELEAERDRLAKALQLLGDDATPAGKATSRRSAPAKRKPARAASSRGKSQSSSRTANRDKALQYLRDHPGAQAGDIVTHLGISRGVAYNLLGRLVEKGAIVRDASGGSRSQYRLAETVEDDSDRS